MNKALSITFDRYHRYQEICSFLQECVREYPDLCRVECIGLSYEGREIQMLEVTNRNSGPGDSKPGVYCDGNTHAGEVTGCEVILYTIKMLLEGYGKDPKITALLDTRVFYFIPRITVDGSELYLTTPYMLRSSTRPWPPEISEPDDKSRLYPEDIDGDGKILEMRVKNPDGAWKVSAKDPRLMVRRRPDELGGPHEIYYDLYHEGLIKDFDPLEPLKPAPDKHRLDFNRQYPQNWATPSRQPGSGDYPFQEPEMKAVGDFYLSHPNIVVSMAYHTSGGLLLRPFADKSDKEFDPWDLAVYQAIGEIGQEMTGYPLRSVYECFTYDPSKPEVGSDLEWAYETLGILAFETELWDMRGRAGIPKRTLPQMRAMTEREREEDGLKLLKWQDEQCGGALFHPWRAFKHPQLGDVEIGGWEPKFGRQNPPVSLLLEECKKNAEFTLARASATPHIALEKVSVEVLSSDLPGNLCIYKVQAVVKNDGYLPTNVTRRAIRMGQASPVKVSLEGGTIVSGKSGEEIGHLGGRAGGGDAKRKLTWVLEAPKGSEVSIVASAPRAGKARATIMLE